MNSVHSSSDTRESQNAERNNQMGDQPQVDEDEEVYQREMNRIRDLRHPGIRLPEEAGAQAGGQAVEEDLNALLNDIDALFDEYSLLHFVH